jgi:hypothetical protein
MFLIEISLILIKTVSMSPLVSGLRREPRLSPESIASHRLPRPKKAVQRCTSRPGIERMAPKRLGDATRLASVGCPPCDFGPDGAGALLNRHADRIADRIYDPEFRHQRNLSHWGPW